MRAACVVVNTRVCEDGGISPASGSGRGPRVEVPGAAAAADLPMLQPCSAVLEKAGEPQPIFDGETLIPWTVFCQRSSET